MRVLLSVSAVDVTPVFGTQYHDFVGLLVDPVEDAIGPSPGGMDPDEVAAEGFAHSLRVLDESAGDELDHCCRDWLRQSCPQRPCGRRSQDEFEQRRFTGAVREPLPRP